MNRPQSYVACPRPRKVHRPMAVWPAERTPYLALIRRSMPGGAMLAALFAIGALAAAVMP